MYDDNGFQVCLCHDMMTVEKRARQLQRLRQLDDILRGKMPSRKKPIWEDLAGLRLACLKLCVPGATNLDGSSAFKESDLTAIPRMSVAKCNAWLDQRCDGMPTYSTLHFHVCPSANHCCLSMHHRKVAASCQTILWLEFTTYPSPPC